MEEFGGGTNLRRGNASTPRWRKTGPCSGAGKIHHHGFLLLTNPPTAKRTIQIEAVAIHVTTPPN